MHALFLPRDFLVPYAHICREVMDYALVSCLVDYFTNQDSYKRNFLIGMLTVRGVTLGRDRCPGKEKKKKAAD